MEVDVEPPETLDGIIQHCNWKRRGVENMVAVLIHGGKELIFTGHTIWGNRI